MVITTGYDAGGLAPHGRCSAHVFPLPAFRHVLRANCLVKAQRLVSGSLYLLDSREVGHISFRFPDPVPVPMGVWA